MGQIRLNTPCIRVVRDGVPDIELQTINPDLVNWDRTRYRHKWPPTDEAPMLWVTFIAWSAARRTGAIPPDHTYESWESEVLAAEVVTDEEDETGTPTTPGPVPG